MAAAAPAAASAAAPAAGKAAGTAGATAAGTGAAAAGGGLAAKMAGLFSSPWFQLVAPTVLGVVAGQNPQSARGVATGIGAFNTVQNLSDRERLANAFAGYSDVVGKDVEKEIMDRQMNEAIQSLGAEDPSAGPVSTTYAGQPLSVLKAHQAAVKTLPAIARANPSQGGFILADMARRAPQPTPAQPDLYAIKDQMAELFPGHNLSARMTDSGYAVEATSPPTPKPTPKEPPRYTDEQLTAAADRLSNLPPGVREEMTVLGPTGAELRLQGSGPAQPRPGAATGTTAGGAPKGDAGLIQVSIGGTEFLYNPNTQEFIPIPEAVMNQFREVQATREHGGIAGTVVRNPDGTLTIRR